MNYAEAYERVAERIRSLVDDGNADTEVPACPGWSVKDVVAHLAGFFVVGKKADPSAFGPSWGDEVVEERADRSLDECLAEWDALRRAAGPLFESTLGVVALSDALAHEQDIRGALGQPGATDDPGLVPSVEMALSFADQKMQSEKASALRVVTDDIDRQIGSGEPVATLRTSTFELFRTVHGRRTADQARSLDWDGDPGDALNYLFIFGPTEEIVEK